MTVPPGPGARPAKAGEEAIHRTRLHQPAKPGTRTLGTTSCGHCSCWDSGLYSVLTAAQFAALNSICRRQIFTPGEHIFKEGSLITHCAIVIAGVVKLTRTVDGGQTYITNLIFQQDVLGRIFETRHGCTAEAATGVELCIFPRDAFVRLLNRAPRFERQIFTAALHQLDTYHDWTVLLSRRSAYQRLAGFLYLLATRGARGSTGNSARFVVPVRREEIAGLLGVTLETVSRQMTVMKRDALISLVSPREVVVPDIGRLGAVAAAAAPCPAELAFSPRPASAG